MKYLLTILTIICVSSVVTLLVIWPSKPPEVSDAVVTINGHQLSRQVIQEYKSKNTSHGTTEEFIDEIITKQLLITEAQRLNIDKEASFRLALKNFYEHSLIKILMERKDAEMFVKVTEQEVDDYINSFGKTFTFYIVKTTGSLETDSIKRNGEKRTDLFDDLGKNLQLTLASLKVGESTTSFVTSNEKFIVLLEKIEDGPKSQYVPDREDIKNQLLGAKKEAKINSWIKDLRSQASITYHKTQE